VTSTCRSQKQKGRRGNEGEKNTVIMKKNVKRKRSLERMSQLNGENAGSWNIEKYKAKYTEAKGQWGKVESKNPEGK